MRWEEFIDGYKWARKMKSLAEQYYPYDKTVQTQYFFSAIDYNDGDLSDYIHYSALKGESRFLRAISVRKNGLK
jgi:hypothetical protein